MRHFFLLLLLPSLLLASKILSYNVYDRTDRVDIMFTFDTPYEGNLRQSRQSGKIILKLEGASIEAPKLKNVTSPFLSKLAITPIAGETQIIATVPDSTTMQASKTSDAYGLRLRFISANTAKATSAATALTPAAATSTLPTKPTDQYEQSYYIVIAILIVGIIILFLLKRKITASTPSKPWLFSGGKQGKQEGVTIRFQKALDQKNRVVMMEYGDESYLVVIGSSNLLLDKFHGNKPVTENEFESMLKDKHQELDSFLQIDKQQQEPLESYKQKASGINYTIAE